MTDRQRERQARTTAYVHVRAAIVELARASAVLDVRKKPSSPALPEFYETNVLLIRLEALSRRIK